MIHDYDTLGNVISYINVNDVNASFDGNDFRKLEERVKALQAITNKVTGMSFSEVISSSLASIQQAFEGTKVAGKTAGEAMKTMFNLAENKYKKISVKWEQ